MALPEGAKPLRVIVEVESVSTNSKGEQFVDLKFVQRPVTQGEEDESDVAVMTSDAIPDGDIKMRLDTEAARTAFAAGDQFMLTFSNIPRL